MTLPYEGRLWQAADCRPYEMTIPIIAQACQNLLQSPH